MKTIIILLSCITINCMGVNVSSNLLNAIAIVESNNRNYVVGDNHLKDKAYGVMQIRKQYLQDFNRIYSKECKEKYGRLLTLEDMRTSPEKSKYVVSKYLMYYGSVYEKRTGLKATSSILAKIHNGGPYGYRKDYKNLYAMTSKYSDKVMKHYTG